LFVQRMGAHRPILLERVLLNFVSMRCATPRGACSLAVDVTRYVDIEVLDTGPGVRRDQREKIFGVRAASADRRFSKAEDNPGLGLDWRSSRGFAICWRLPMTFDQRFAGLSFSVTLPAGTLQVGHHERPTEPSLSSTLASPLSWWSKMMRLSWKE